MSALDTQIAGNHYKKWKIQPAEFIIANDLDWFQGNVIKYALRHKDKNGADDIKKIIHYCQLLLELTYEKKVLNNEKKDIQEEKGNT